MLASIALFVLPISAVSALGINCRGSSSCAGAGGKLSEVITGATQADQNKVFNSGEHVACSKKLCAFYQNGASGTAAQAVGFLQQLASHGCDKCGSVPTQPGNDVGTGELTVNFVV